MALATTDQEDYVHVPWLSSQEWLHVYKQIYSGNLGEQKKAFQTLLVWKARIPKLPIGVECTLSLMQISLKDREWTEKIDNSELPITYENDLKMMYSNVVVKVLNHISSIAYKKQTSLFVIAKQFNIPQWIVDIRHDSAHGNELPSIDIMRIVVNIFLAWLHEEYWVAEAKNIEKNETVEDLETAENCTEYQISELIEIWTAVRLYIETKHSRLSDINDAEFKESLKNIKRSLTDTLHLELGCFKSNAPIFHDHTELIIISKTLLIEISKLLGKDKFINKHRIVTDIILNNEVFIPSTEVYTIFNSEKVINNEDIYSNLTVLSNKFIEFWTDFILILQEKKVLPLLFLFLIDLAQNENETKHRRHFASLWVKLLAQAIRKQKIAQTVGQTLEQNLESNNEKMSVKAFTKTVQEYVNTSYPELKEIMWLNTNCESANLLKNKRFLKKLIMNINDYSQKFVLDILKLSATEIPASTKEKLIDLIKIFSAEENNENISDDIAESDQVYTLQELEENFPSISSESKGITNLADSEIRNTTWKLAEREYDWSSCPFGILPWQIGSETHNNKLIVPESSVEYVCLKKTNLPQIIDSTNLHVHSKIQWEKIMKKLNKSKKKSKTSAIVQAMENVRIINEKNKV